MCVVIVTIIIGDDDDDDDGGLGDENFFWFWDTENEKKIHRYNIHTRTNERTK